MMKRMMRARVQIYSQPPAFMMRDRELSWWKNQLNWQIQVQGKSKRWQRGANLTAALQLPLLPERNRSVIFIPLSSMKWKLEISSMLEACCRHLRHHHQQQQQQQQAQINEPLLDTLYTSKGSPQGGILSLFLFILHTDEYHSSRILPLKFSLMLGAAGQGLNIMGYSTHVLHPKFLLIPLGGAHAFPDAKKSRN
ncbi:hypothetical protein NQZ68_022560 [Dissostichus eleginoides]|nr:hypothetical protein NQZ68_022560 [Dissostichus eleginoides]